ncbi:MAG: NAD(P)H-dependent oxidoreductase [Proteobacteria bacterium]|nr:NAD(P)H-dependent oxidoreductase [Pseudomonadota bacterium]
MNTVSSEAIVAQLNWRYATKAFDPAKKISEQDWKVLADSICLTPTSYGLQPLKALVVQNPAKRKELRAVSWDQSQVEDCSHYVVLVTLKKVTEEYVKKYIARISEVRGVPAEQLKGYEEMMLGDIVRGPRAEIAHFWAQRQAYIAMGFLLETAALRGIDACPMEGLDPAQYDKILGLAGSEYATVAAVALGYRSASDNYQSLKKVRFKDEQLIEIVR